MENKRKGACVNKDGGNQCGNGGDLGLLPCSGGEATGPLWLDKDLHVCPLRPGNLTGWDRQSPEAGRSPVCSWPCRAPLESARPFMVSLCVPRSEGRFWQAARPAFSPFCHSGTFAGRVQATCTYAGTFTSLRSGDIQQLPAEGLAVILLIRLITWPGPALLPLAG